MGAFFLERNVSPQDPGMKNCLLTLEILLLVLLCLMAVLALARTVSAAPVELPSGIVLDLSKEQVEAIKTQPGISFEVESVETLSPGDGVVSLPDKRGGGHLYGRPAHLSRASGSVGTTRSPTTPKHLSVNERSFLCF